MSIKVKLDVFEGPLNLLLHLIEKNKLNIYDIPIVMITEQYLAYLSQMEKFNMEITSDFLVMAATLLNIKAKMLLPIDEKKENEEDPREDLVKKLLEYKKFKYAAEKLKPMQTDSIKILFKKASFAEEISDIVVSIDEILNEISLEQLYAIYIRLINQRENSIDPIRSKFNSIQKEKYTIEEKIKFLIEELNRLKNISFTKAVLKQKSKSESITFFLAVLELIKMNKIIISQNGVFHDIKIKLNNGSVKNEVI